MKYVVAENKMMFEIFLSIFAIGKSDCYKYIGNENWRGLSRETIFILFEDYEKNEEWKREYLPVFLDSCLNVYLIKRLDWIYK